MAQITYTDKVALNENPEIAAINKVSDDDMNEIKSVVNANYNNTIQITNSQPTDSDNKIWIDTGEIAQAHTEITNEYSTSTGLGYSANYINNNVGVVESGSNANGSYVKYADGTMICYIKKENVDCSSLLQDGTYYYKIISDILFPQSFIAIPIISISVVNKTDGRRLRADCTLYNTKDKIGQLIVSNYWNSTDAYVNLDIIAIGRWK